MRWPYRIQQSLILKYFLDNDQDDWNNYSHDDNDSQYEDSDEPQDAPSISGDDLDEGTSDQEALDALLEQYDQD